MLQISLMVFREILEIAIVIGVLCAVTKELKHRSYWIFSGAVIGIFGSIALAFFMKSISQSFAGYGKELFNATILLFASLMIGFTVIWMQTHARAINTKLKEVGKAIENKEKSLFILSFITFFTIIREGAEIVLFSYSHYISYSNINALISGITVGLFIGCGVGIAFYCGMMRAFGKYFFKITSYFLILLSSAILMKSIGYFVKAGIIPALGSPVIDLSTILPKASIIGQFLHVTIGYIDKPYGSQLISYICALLILLLLTYNNNKKLNKI